MHIVIQDPPEMPINHNQMNNSDDIFQLWSLSGESCPDGTIPIIRTKEQDILRAGSISRFGRKFLDNDTHEVRNHKNSIFFLSFFPLFLFISFFLVIIKLRNKQTTNTNQL
jgi:hypothetical protein